MKKAKKIKHPKGGYRELIKVAVPLILSTASYSIMHFLDRVMLAKYSDVAAAGSTASGALSFALISFFIGVVAYTSTYVAQYYGAGERKMCAVSLWQGFYFALLASILAPFFLKPLGISILNYAGHAPKILEQEIIYFSILTYAAFGPLMNNVFGAFFGGRGDTLTIMVVNVFGALINVFLNYCMIFGELGFAELGIAGAAYATVIAQSVTIVCYIILISRRPWRRLYGIYRYWKPHWSSFKKLVRYGGPSGISFGLDILAFSTFILLVGKLGKAELIATNFTFTINALAFLPMLGISIATSILVGQHKGENNLVAAEKTTYNGVRLSVIYISIASLIFVLFPDYIFNIFKGKGISDELFSEVLVDGRCLLCMLSLLGIFDAINLNFSNALKGAGDTLFPMCMSVLLAWMFYIPGAYLSIKYLPNGLYWAWIFLDVYVILLGGAFWWRFKSGKWKSIEIKEKSPPIVDGGEGFNFIEN